MFYNNVKNFVGFFLKILYKLEIYGEENIPKDNKRLIICGNHRSNLDPVFISLAFRRQVFWMAKKELFEFKPLGWFLTKLGAFPVDRHSNDIKAIKNSLKILKNENVLGIFPEGTRVKEIDYNMIKSGVALIAQKTNSEVLPIFIESEYKFFKPIRVYFRPSVAIESTKKYDNEELEKISQDIMRMVYGEETKWKLL
ncbi:1-acyl-sn-glycerol-3-phosphate acyltransferase [Peptoniphilus sp. MSJ-1]|uniref:1-acyl-sn-glycerol-3-phosphate acyltransferase n=1 Tax=Peptoniphilus ovalis TaxID=2841503 RepID=A0ABS6FIV1_9FIRM|nr:lysophospholipid acyltransferase family protein [Peptoniphilus ovalis]MBU5669166.1 1-acyl-sn-glycerol-3-phosphate acyltransferase [Peptoniphilus ovalis]